MQISKVSKTALTFSDDAKNYDRLHKDGAVAFDRHLLLALSD